MACMDGNFSRDAILGGIFLKHKSIKTTAKRKSVFEFGGSIFPSDFSNSSQQIECHNESEIQIIEFFEEYLP